MTVRKLGEKKEEKIEKEFNIIYSVKI